MLILLMSWIIKMLPECTVKMKRHLTYKNQQAKKYTSEKKDRFCFSCHQEVNLRSISCRTCPRSYHVSCLKKNKFNNDECPECSRNNLNGLDLCSDFPSETLKTVLTYAVRTVDPPQFILSCLPNEHSYRLVNIVDWESVIDRINSHENMYKNLKEFYSHMSWILHNSYIIYGGKSKEKQIALKFIKNLELEVLDIAACYKCYLKAHSADVNFFTKICDELHPLIWAKMKSFPYWPAKCLKVIGQSAVVKFFGTHDGCTLALKNCYKLSRNNPSGNKIKNRKYALGVEELEEYITNFEAKYGAFSYADKGTAFSSADMNTQENIRISENGQNLQVSENGQNFQISENGQNFQISESGQNFQISENGQNFQISENDQNLRRVRMPVIRIKDYFSCKKESVSTVQSEPVFNSVDSVTTTITDGSETSSFSSNNHSVPQSVIIKTDPSIEEDVPRISEVSSLHSDEPVPESCDSEPNTSLVVASTSTDIIERNIKSSDNDEQYEENVSERGDCYYLQNEFTNAALDALYNLNLHVNEKGSNAFEVMSALEALCSKCSEFTKKDEAVRKRAEEHCSDLSREIKNETREIKEISIIEEDLKRMLERPEVEEQLKRMKASKNPSKKDMPQSIPLTEDKSSQKDFKQDVREEIERTVSKLEKYKSKEMENAKGKTYCAFCKIRPAIMMCCLNTNYCSERCFECHYKEHAPLCTQPVYSYTHVTSCIFEARAAPHVE